MDGVQNSQTKFRACTIALYVSYGEEVVVELNQPPNSTQTEAMMSWSNEIVDIAMLSLSLSLSDGCKIVTHRHLQSSLAGGV